MIGIPIGLLYANAVEWSVHKYVLHGLGKNKKSIWSFHWHEHHKNVRRNGHVDPEYARKGVAWNGPAKEAVGLAAMALAHLPIAPVAPFFFGTVLYSAGRYWYVHRKSHLDPEWARENLPWHYDHHMGPDQDANWCVSKPWADDLLGTRIPYVGTPEEAEARAKAEAKQKKRAA